LFCTYLDEAHSIWAVGKTWRGVCELVGVDPVDVYVMMWTSWWFCYDGNIYKIIHLDRVEVTLQHQKYEDDSYQFLIFNIDLINISFTELTLVPYTTIDTRLYLLIYFLFCSATPIYSETILYKKCSVLLLHLNTINICQSIIVEI
jgi:hypothetical protein